MGEAHDTGFSAIAVQQPAHGLRIDAPPSTPPFRGSAHLSTTFKPQAISPHGSPVSVTRSSKTSTPRTNPAAIANSLAEGSLLVSRGGSTKRPRPTAVERGDDRQPLPEPGIQTGRYSVRRRAADSAVETANVAGISASSEAVALVRAFKASILTQLAVKDDCAEPP